MIWYMLRTLVGARRVPWEGRGGGQVSRFDQGIGCCRLSGGQSSGALYIIKLLLREGVGRPLRSLNGLFKHGGGVIERDRLVGLWWREGEDWGSRWGFHQEV